MTAHTILRILGAVPIKNDASSATAAVIGCGGSRSVFAVVFTTFGNLINIFMDLINGRSAIFSSIPVDNYHKKHSALYTPGPDGIESPLKPDDRDSLEQYYDDHLDNPSSSSSSSSSSGSGSYTSATTAINTRYEESEEFSSVDDFSVFSEINDDIS